MCRVLTLPPSATNASSVSASAPSLAAAAALCLRMTLQNCANRGHRILLYQPPMVSVLVRTQCYWLLLYLHPCQTPLNTTAHLSKLDLAAVVLIHL